MGSHAPRLAAGRSRNSAPRSRRHRHAVAPLALLAIAALLAGCQSASTFLPPGGTAASASPGTPTASSPSATAPATATRAHISGPTATATPTATETESPTPTPRPAKQAVYRLEPITQEGGATTAIAALDQRVLFGQGMRLAVADVRDPDNPRTIGRSVPLSGVVNCVAADGDLAWVGTSDGTLYSLTITEGGDPAVLGELTLPDAAQAMAARAGWVFVAAGAAGLVAVDGRVPTRPTIVDTLVPDKPAMWTFDLDQDLVLVDSTAWLAGGARGVADLYAIDVSTPDRLGLIGTSIEAVRHIAVAGPHHLLVDRGDLQLLDVRDPNHPTVLRAQRFREHRLSALAVAGQRAVLVTDTIPRMVRSFDLARMSPDDASNVTGHEDPDGRWPGAGPAAAQGPYVYVASGYGGGFDVLRASPRDVEYRGYVDFLGAVDAVTASDGWAHADIANHGLTVMDMADPGHPVARGSVAIAQWSPRLSVLAQPTAVANLPTPATPTTPNDAAIASSVVASGITTDYMAGNLTIVDVADPDQPAVSGDVYEGAGVGGHVVLGRHVYAETGTRSRVFDVSNPARPVARGDLPYVVVAADGNRGAAVATAAPEVLLMLDMTRPEQPTILGRRSFPGAIASVAIVANRAYVLTRGAAVHLHVLGDLRSGDPRLLGTTVVDPLASQVVPAPGGALVAYWPRDIYAARHAGVQLVTVDAAGTPRIADVAELPDAGASAVAGDYAYVPAHVAGLIVLRVQRLAGRP